MAATKFFLIAYLVFIGVSFPIIFNAHVEICKEQLDWRIEKCLIFERQIISTCNGSQFENFNVNALIKCPSINKPIFYRLSNVTIQYLLDKDSNIKIQLTTNPTISDIMYCTFKNIGIECDKIKRYLLTAEDCTQLNVFKKSIKMGISLYMLIILIILLCYASSMY